MSDGLIRVVPVVSQATFDAAVAENIHDFGLSPDDAIKDAIIQFEKQGVDLSSIFKGVKSEGEGEGKSEEDKRRERDIISAVHALERACERASAAAAAAAADLADVAESLEGFDQVLGQDKDNPNIAGCNGAIQALIAAVDVSVARGDSELTAKSLASLGDCMVCGFNREVLAAPGIQAIVAALTRFPASPAVCHRGLRTLAKACVKDENNRQDFMAANVAPLVVAAIRAHMGSHPVVRAACDSFVALTLGDDPRAAMTKAHEHVRALQAAGMIEALTEVTATALVQEHDTASAVLHALSKCAVRDEFCVQMLDLHVLDTVETLFSQHGTKPKFAKHACSLLRALACNDAARIMICKGNALGIVLDTFQTASADPGAATEACGAFNTLSMRNQSNCEIIAHKGGLSLLVQAMREHPGVAALQRYAAASVRNLVVRNPENKGQLLADGVEELLRGAMEAHPTARDHAKAALRDLGCKVELKEEWKGERGALARD